MKCKRCGGFVYTSRELTRDANIAVLTDVISCAICGWIAVRPHRSKKNNMKRKFTPKKSRYNHRGR